MSTSDLRVPHRVLIAGATGYVGSRLAERLHRRGHEVTALVRASSRLRAASNRALTGCNVVTGDALDESSYTAAARGIDTLVHLVGVAHPSPAKAAQFEAIDLASARTAAWAAKAAGVQHIVYVSVARPAPVMHAYLDARRRAEEAFTATAIPCTFLQPWYVVGPGHYWPILILPMYKLLEWLPATRTTALRLGLVSINTMLSALVHAIENPPAETRLWDVPTLRRLSSGR